MSADELVRELCELAQRDDEFALTRTERDALTSVFEKLANASNNEERREEWARVICDNCV